MGERQFGPYTLVHQIAVGGMAEIHLAKTSGIAGFEKYVALKMIHPNFSQDEQFIQMLIDEAKISVQLQHVNIAQTFDLGRVGETYYITMEYVDGADLYKLLRKGAEQDKDVPVPIAAHIAKEVATGLDYAHRKRDMTGTSLGIVHRDVSPQNVLISHAGEIKLVDFGIAKATMRARQTQVGVIKGKYYYMSPEQAWGETLDHRTDIFSTGILLYEALTGQMLYLEEDLHRLLNMVRKADIKPPSTLRKDIPPQLERIVMHALQKSPEDRYQTAADLATDLERFLHVYSPVFTSTKVANWLAEVLPSDPPPPGVVKPKPPVEQSRETKRLESDQLVRTRDELPDENSVIFNVRDFARGASEQRGAEDATAALSAQGQVPGPEEKDRGGAAPSDPRSEQRRPPNVATREFGHAIAEEPSESATAAEPPGIIELDIEDRTVVSGPPGFGDEAPEDGDTGDTSPSSEVPPIPPVIEEQGEPGLQTLNEPTLIQEAEQMSDESPTLPQPGASLSDSAGGDLSGSDGNPEGPTIPRQRPRWEPAPALAAKNPEPAVSAIRPPRRSRKTPGKGIPSAGGSVLSSLLTGPGARRGPMVAITSPEGAQGTGAPAGGSGGGQLMPPGQFLQAAQAQSAPSGAFPTGAPPASATRQLAALELDEIPDIYKIDRGRRGGRAWLWGGLVFAACVAAGALIGIYGFGGGSEAHPATLEIVSIPPGAEVQVDGEKLEEKTPVDYVDAMSGETYLLSFGLPQHKRKELETTVPKDQNRHQIIVRLDKIKVKLTVKSQPPGASVYVNGKSMGTTPLVLEDLDPSDARTVELRKKGYQPVFRSLEWDLSDPEQEVMLLLDQQKK